MFFLIKPNNVGWQEPLVDHVDFGGGQDLEFDRGLIKLKGVSGT